MAEATLAEDTEKKLNITEEGGETQQVRKINYLIIIQVNNNEIQEGAKKKKKKNKKKKGNYNHTLITRGD